MGNRSLSKRIANDIATQIIKGELNPGDKLVESVYAEHYGTSRAPVREALYLLTTEGLLERIPRRGAIVKEYSNTEIFDLLDIRNMLEMMAINRIKENGLDKKLLDELYDIVEQMDLKNAVYSYTKLNYNFHFNIIRMSHSDPIIDTYNRLGTPLLRVQNLSFSLEGNINKSIKEHEEIYTLLKDEKYSELEALLQEHNLHVIKSVRKFLNNWT